MSFFGTHLTILMGGLIPLPAPPSLLRNLESAEVYCRDRERGGFQLVFALGRGGLTGIIDYPQLTSSLRPFSRVVMTVLEGLMPTVLIDGVITQTELVPSNTPGETRYIVTGEDLSVLMDLEEKITEYPMMNEMLIVERILLTYIEYGIIPTVIPPPLLDPPLITERIPVQHGTDYQYLNKMAARFGYYFCIEPGPVPLTSRAYWGPPKRASIPQPALSVNMGDQSTVTSMNILNDGLAPATTSGTVQDFLLGAVPVEGPVSTRIVPLAAMPSLFMNPKTRHVLLDEVGGLDIIEATTRALAKTSYSTDNVITVNGELDTVAYGHILTPGGIVGVRGVGMLHDGFYAVKEVTHKFEKASYKQSFSLAREGLETLTPVVRP